MAENNLRSRSKNSLLAGLLAGYLGLTECVYGSSLPKPNNLESLLSDQNFEDQTKNAKPKLDKSKLARLAIAEKILPLIPEKYRPKMSDIITFDKARAFAVAFPEPQRSRIMQNAMFVWFPRDPAERPTIYVSLESDYMEKVLTDFKAERDESPFYLVFAGVLAEDGYKLHNRELSEAEGRAVQITVVEKFVAEGRFEKFRGRINIASYLNTLKAQLAEEQAKEQRAIPSRPKHN
ncbi:MAG: hypothetical protein AABX79_01860 [Nanoarchaeota archaeon]